MTNAEKREAYECLGANLRLAVIDGLLDFGELGRFAELKVLELLEYPDSCESCQRAGIIK
jgi:hypothetical protein